MKKVLTLLFALMVTIGCFATNRALLVGIGKYPKQTTGWKVIHGDADVALLKPLLVQQGFTDIHTLVNAEATKGAILSELNKLVASAKPGDKIYIHFSGHGQPIEDANGDEIEDDFPFDQSFIPYDAYRSPIKGKYSGERHLIDDELTPILNKLKTKVGKNGGVFMAVDACYSRGMERGEGPELEAIDDPDVLNSARGCGPRDAFVVPGRTSYLKRVPKPKRFTPGNGTLTVVSACKADQRNFEYKVNNRMYGSLSYYIATLLKNSADFSVWANAFTNHGYQSTGIFKYQTPTIEIHK